MVPLAAQTDELSARFGRILRFREDFVAEREDLIASQDETLGIFLRNTARFVLRERVGEVPRARTFVLEGRSDGGFVDSGGLDSVRNGRIPEHLGANFGSGREDELRLHVEKPVESCVVSSGDGSEENSRDMQAGGQMPSLHDESV
jgi:hypothetical protein